MKSLVSLFVLFCQAGLVPAAERVALVVGNDTYLHARSLNAAVSDATAVAASLQKLGFNTITASNAGLEQMIEAMDTLKAKAAGAQAVLVYYAGHGIESEGANYLIPVDAKLEKEVQLQTQAVNLNSVLDKLTALNVPARMVILDCCRDNPLEGRAWLATRGVGGGLGELPVQTLPAATLVVYSASPGKPALDRVYDTDTHSPFTQALLDTLPVPGVHSFEIFGRVEESVLERTGGRQSPRVFYNGSTLPFRNFTFAPAIVPPAMPQVTMLSNAAVVQAPLPPALPANAESTPPAASPPVLPVLPASGFFNLDTLFTGSSYAGYNSYSRSQILRQVQMKLKSAGLYSSDTDGVAGPGTQRAIMAWQQGGNLPLTGKLDAATIDSLGLAGQHQQTSPKPAPRSPRSSAGSAQPIRSTPQQPSVGTVDDALFR